MSSSAVTSVTAAGNIKPKSTAPLAISVRELGKCYQIYETPRDRLKQFILPRLQRAIGKKPKQYFREFWALKNISFDVERGETVAIVGRNGCGKSTLLQLLCGTLSPTIGNIDLDGRIAALLELGAGFNPEFTGRENVFLNASLYGLTHEQIVARYDQVVAFAEIGDFIDQPVKTYSSGMFMRLAFAVATQVDAEILIIDEALAVGDVYFVQKCMRRFHELKAKGVTIFLVTHDPTAVKLLCDRALWLNDGMLAHQGAAVETVNRYLANISQQDYVETPSASQLTCTSDNSAKGVDEYSLPNIGLRLGNQDCSIVGAELYGEDDRRIRVVKNLTTIRLRLTIINKSAHYHDGASMIVGYTIRNSRGIDISSGNSEEEGVVVRMPDIGNRVGVNIYIALPCIHPGDYSICAAISHRDSTGNIVNLDTIEDLVVFSIVSDKKVFVLLSFESQFVVE